MVQDPLPQRGEGGPGRGLGSGRLRAALCTLMLEVLGVQDVPSS